MLKQKRGVILTVFSVCAVSSSLIALRLRHRFSAVWLCCVWSVCACLAWSSVSRFCSLILLFSSNLENIWQKTFSSHCFFKCTFFYFLPLWALQSLFWNNPTVQVGLIPFSAFLLSGLTLHRVCGVSSGSLIFSVVPGLMRGLSCDNSSQILFPCLQPPLGWTHVVRVSFDLVVFCVHSFLSIFAVL